MFNHSPWAIECSEFSRSQLEKFGGSTVIDILAAVYQSNVITGESFDEDPSQISVRPIEAEGFEAGSLGTTKSDRFYFLIGRRDPR